MPERLPEGGEGPAKKTLFSEQARPQHSSGNKELLKKRFCRWNSYNKFLNALLISITKYRRTIRKKIYSITTASGLGIPVCYFRLLPPPSYLLPIFSEFSPFHFFFFPWPLRRFFLCFFPTSFSHQLSLQSLLSYEIHTLFLTYFSLLLPISLAPLFHSKSHYISFTAPPHLYKSKAFSSIMHAVTSITSLLSAAVLLVSSASASSLSVPPSHLRFRRAATAVVPTSPGPGQTFNEGATCLTEWTAGSGSAWKSMTISRELQRR